MPELKLGENFLYVCCLLTSAGANIKDRLDPVEVFGTRISRYLW